jgi:protein-L-isoaspartate(D-aspartate) O-methyltransferase
MAELLRLRPGDRVLDVGTGSGYAAAVLSTIAGEVWSIERHPTLAAEAAALLEELGYDQVHVVTGDGSRGWPAAAPFDAISVAASAPDVPVALTDQLADGGRLVLPVDHPDGGQDLVLVERHGDELTRRVVLAVRFVPLVADHEAPVTDADD